MTMVDLLVRLMFKAVNIICLGESQLAAHRSKCDKSQRPLPLPGRCKAILVHR